MVLNINDIATKQHEGNIVTNHFLQEYQNLLIDLKSAFKEHSVGSISNNGVFVHITRMKDFAIKNGGLKCVELLAEYEKNYAIGDLAACNAMEVRILTELNSFKEFWVSILA